MSLCHDSNVTMDGLTIKGGIPSGSSDQDSGGGIGTNEYHIKY